MKLWHDIQFKLYLCSVVTNAIQGFASPYCTSSSRRPLHSLCRPCLHGHLHHWSPRPGQSSPWKQSETFLPGTEIQGYIYVPMQLSSSLAPLGQSGAPCKLAVFPTLSQWAEPVLTYLQAENVDGGAANMSTPRTAISVHPEQIIVRLVYIKSFPRFLLLKIPRMSTIGLWKEGHLIEQD